MIYFIVGFFFGGIIEMVLYVVEVITICIVALNMNMQARCMIRN